MASAGRILIIPRGVWEEATTYEMLDMVNYGGTSWIAKKTSTGIAPSSDNIEYWYDVFGTSTDELSNRILAVEGEMDEAQSNISNLQAGVTNLETRASSHETRMEELQTEIDNKTASIQIEEVNYTLLASSWVGESAPYTYDLSAEYPDAEKNIDLLADIESLTAEQREAMINAQITGGTRNKLYALGEKPAIDIPIVLEVTAK